MKSFGKLASVASIAAVLFLLGALPSPASAGAKSTKYAGKLGSVKTEITRTGRRLDISVTMDLKCSHKTVRSTGHVTTKVDPKTGKFRYITPANERKVSVGAWFTDIIGRVSDNGKVRGRVGQVHSDHFSGNYTCVSGKSLKNFWMPFKANPVDLSQSSTYKYRSDDLRIKLVAKDDKVFVESLRDHRTCSGDGYGGWGKYFNETPLKVKGDGSFGFKTTDDFGQTMRIQMKAKIHERTIRGWYLYSYSAEDESTGDSTRCWTGKSYFKPKVKFQAHLVG